MRHSVLSRLPLVVVSAFVASALVLGIPALAANIVGTRASDVLRGTPKADRIDGKAGNDRMLGLAGSDVLIGGAGRDFVDGGPGDDRLLIRDGRLDTVTCGAGRDLVTADTADVVRASCETVIRPQPPLPPAACANGRDDDTDGKVDYPADPGCADASDTDETDPLPAPVAITPGAYKGLLDGDYVYFEVLPTRAITHFRSNYIQEDCDRGGYVYGTLDPSDARYPIAADGSFRYSETTSGIVEDEPATFTVEITGQFTGTDVAGTIVGSSEFEYKEIPYKCASGRKTWTASLQP